MSNFYLDILKDRLYVENANSKSRRAAQTTIYMILDAMTRLVSPILAFTSEEIWQAMRHGENDDSRSVLFNNMPSLTGIIVDGSFKEYWDKIHLLRDEVQKSLELARKNKVIGSSLDAKVTLYCENNEIFNFIKSSEKDLKTIFIVSKVQVKSDGLGEIKSDQFNGVSITITHASGNKCERCWVYSDTVGQNTKHDSLCDRCVKILENQK